MANAKKKTLEERLLENASNVSSHGRSSINNLAQFLASKEEIKKALSNGWNMKFRWKTLHEEKAFWGNYNCFTIYVKKHIRLVQGMQLEHDEVQISLQDIVARTFISTDSTIFQPSNAEGKNILHKIEGI